MKPADGKHHLLIDADDTLWENNVYFEDAFDQFVDFLDHSSMSATGIRTVLDEIEIANIKIHGYGAANFARNLAQCYERLAEREIRNDDLRTVMSYVERILDCPMQLIEGVSETLAYLNSRHELTLSPKDTRKSRS
jgi:putative hydrolase of the HAD superfamily